MIVVIKVTKCTNYVTCIVTALKKIIHIYVSALYIFIYNGISQ